MSNFNKAIIMGNLTRDPELKETNSGKKVTEFSVAVNSGWGDNKKVAFLGVVCWEKKAEYVCSFANKGTPVMVEGEIVQDVWDGKDGTQQRKTKISAQNIQVIFPPKNRATSTQEEDDDDLPF